MECKNYVKIMPIVKIVEYMIIIKTDVKFAMMDIFKKTMVVGNFNLIYIFVLKKTLTKQKISKFLIKFIWKYFLVEVIQKIMVVLNVLLTTIF